MLNAGMEATHCVACHPFADTTASSLLPRREDCLRCHAETAKQLHVAFPEKGPMAWDCGTCHHPHAAGEGKPVSPGTAECTACHEELVKSGALHKLHVGDEEKACVDCHHPHDWRAGLREVCGKCHEDEASEDHFSGHACAGCHNDAHLYPKDEGDDDE